MHTIQIKLGAQKKTKSQQYGIGFHINHNLNFYNLYLELAASKKYVKLDRNLLYSLRWEVQVCNNIAEEWEP